MESPKILVVDDESRMRKLVKDFLEKKNFHVLEAGDGEEAMDIFYEEKVGFYIFYFQFFSFLFCSKGYFACRWKFLQQTAACA